MKKYFPRLIEKTIEEQMEIIGAIVIEGPKWSGKSTTSERYAKTIIKLQDPIVFRRYQLYASSDRNLLLRGDKPLMFDEWQKIPDLWDFIRTNIDEQNSRGHYILTGSSKPIEDQGRHTGTGRFVKLKMRPMSLYEMNYSSGSVSLSELFSKDVIEIVESKISIEEIAQLICRGGWPGSLDLNVNQAIKMVENYYETLTSEDIANIDDIKRDATRAKLILRSFSRHVSTLTPYTRMVADIINRGDKISDETFYSYIRTFEKLYVVDNIPAWSPKLRSKASVRTADKKQLIDPSLAAVALNANPNDLIKDLNTFGFLFESLCSKDLAVYIESLGGKLSHYRDSDGLEIDAIVHLPDGRWGAIEIKLSSIDFDKASANLFSLKNKIDEKKEPSFLMILSGTDVGYQREDGIYIVPLACLKP